MRFILYSVVLSCVLGTGYAEKPKLEPYGFLKGDMYLTKGGVRSWGKPSLTCASSASGEDTSAVSFTAQHSRFGLKGGGATGAVTMGGVLELDFFTVAANANAKPRMRLAYAWCKPLAGLEIRAGQDWDLFSPLNPTTNNTNANLWYNGNYGFRRPQLMLGYSLAAGPVKPNIKISAGEPAREDDLSVTQAADSTKKVTMGTWLGEDNLSGLPLMQGRLGVVFLEKMEAGMSALYAAYGPARAYSTQGFSFDASLPVHKLLHLKGEAALGRNLNNANLFTVAGNGSAALDVTTIGFWFDLTSKPMDFLNMVLGFGDERVTSEITNGAVESNLTFYGDLIFPLGEHFSLSAEYQFLRTAVKAGDPRTAHLLDVAGKVVF